MTTQFKIYERFAGEEFKIIVVDTSCSDQEHQVLLEIVKQFTIPIEIIRYDLENINGSMAHGKGLQYIYEMIRNNESVQYFLTQDPDFFWVKPQFLTYLKEKLQTYTVVGAPYHSPRVAGWSGHMWFPAAFGAAYRMEALRSTDADFTHSVKRAPDGSIRDVGWLVRERLAEQPYFYFQQHRAPLPIGKTSFEMIWRRYTDSDATIAYHLHRGSFEGHVSVLPIATEERRNMKPPNEWIENREKACIFFWEEIVMDKPMRETPYRSPIVVSEALQDILKDKIVCEMGCAEGDNLMFMSRYAKRVFGLERDEKRYPIAQKRGFEVIVGDYFEDEIPDAEVYYFWPNDTKDNPLLIERILEEKPGFTGYILVGGDPGMRGEEQMVRKIADEYGKLREVPYNEGEKHCQSGVFLVAVVDVKALREKKQKFVLVLSAPRCGSSCTTGCLSLCGLNIGKTPTTVKGQWNAKGYFENQRILRFNDKALTSIGLSIANPTLLTTEQIQFLHENFETMLRDILKEQFAPDMPSLIKDPRIIILWPLYRAVFAAMNADVKIIVLHRSQDSCARSLVRFPAFKVTYEQGVHLHNRYYEIIASELEKEFESVHTHFEHIIGNTIKTVGVICEFLGLEFDDQQKKNVLAFVDNNLVNFK